MGLVTVTVTVVIQKMAVEFLMRRPATLEELPLMPRWLLLMPCPRSKASRTLFAVAHHRKAVTKTSSESEKIVEVIVIGVAIAAVATEMETEKAIQELVSHQLEQNGSERSQIRETIVRLQRKPQWASVLRETRLGTPGTQTKSGVHRPRQQRQSVHQEKKIETMAA